MNETLGSWWRARTPRERLLISLAGWLAFIVAAPLMVWQAASGFRHDSEAALARAQSLAAAVDGLDPELVARAPALRGSPQEVALAQATALGLTIAQVEETGPGRVRVRFEPGDSLAVLTFIDQVTRAGFTVDRTALVRVDEGGLVQAELELSGAGA
jgi:type II secretory pathway component PulM